MQKKVQTDGLFIGGAQTDKFIIMRASLTLYTEWGNYAC